MNLIEHIKLLIQVIGGEIKKNSPIGKHSIYIPASAMLPVKGLAPKSKITYPPGRADPVATADFSASLMNSSTFQIAMPKSWDAGAVQFQLYWLCDHMVKTDGATFGMVATSYAQGEKLEKSGENQVRITSKAVANKAGLIISTVSGDLIVKDAAANKFTVFFIWRDVSDAGDTIPVDVKLIGINLTYTTDKSTDN